MGWNHKLEILGEQFGWCIFPYSKRGSFCYWHHPWPCTHSWLDGNPSACLFGNTSILREINAPKTLPRIYWFSMGLSCIDRYGSDEVCSAILIRTVKYWVNKNYHHVYLELKILLVLLCFISFVAVCFHMFSSWQSVRRLVMATTWCLRDYSEPILWQFSKHFLFWYTNKSYIYVYTYIYYLEWDPTTLFRSLQQNLV